MSQQAAILISPLEMSTLHLASFCIALHSCGHFASQVAAENGLSCEEMAVFAEAWLFREKQQRTFDGFYCVDDVSTAFPREFQTLDGPNLPVPGGFQVCMQER